MAMVDKYKDFIFGLIVFYQIQVLHWDMLQPHQVRSSEEKAMTKKNLGKGGGSRASSFSINLQLDWSKCNTKQLKD